MFKNDERYWDINLLNKWFAISSIIFLGVTIWIFVDDNDDEFKEYQREFRKMQVRIEEDKLNQEGAVIASDTSKYAQALRTATTDLNNRSTDLQQLEDQLKELKNRHYNENMNYAGQKAQVDVLKYLVEADNAHPDHGPSHQDEYIAALDKLDDLRIIREASEIEIAVIEKNIKSIKADVKESQDEFDAYTKKYNLTKNKLAKVDRDRMTTGNKLGDIIRDLPIVDFLDPYYKVNQVVVADIKYDVNFAAVPVVDRCTSCHLGIDNPDFSGAPQPYTTHPNLDLYITSSSPHPMNNFGCTSCHAGRSRGTSFVSSSHTPNTPEAKERWEDEYDWEKSK